MKKLFLILSAAVLVSSAFAGGGDAPKKTAGENALVEQGLSLASFMVQKANNDAFLKLVVGNKDKLIKKIREIGAGDVSKPSAVYKITENFSLKGLRMAYSEGFTIDDVPVKIQKEIGNTLAEGIALMFTRKKSGELGVGAITALKAENAFISKETVGFCTPYVFIFESAYPVMVIFFGEKGDVIRASATFVLDRDIITELDESGVSLERIQ